MIDDAAIAEVEASVLRKIENDEMTLPALPTVVAKAMVLLRGKDFSFAKIAAVIEPDAMVAARIIRRVNSAALATRQRAASIADAVSRLGASGLQMFLMDISAGGVFSSNDPRINQVCRGLWEHSLGVALLSRDLAAKAAPGEEEPAYMGGLLHDIGKPIVATMLLEAEKRMVGAKTHHVWMEPEAWLRVIAGTHRRVGVAVAAKWQLPESVAGAIKNCSVYDKAAPRATANIVRLANAVAKQVGVYSGAIDPAEIASLIGEGAALLGIDPSSVQAMGGTLVQRVRQRATA